MFKGPVTKKEYSMLKDIIVNLGRSVNEAEEILTSVRRYIRGNRKEVFWITVKVLDKPFEDMPLFISSRALGTAPYAMWRLKIGR